MRFRFLYLLYILILMSIRLKADDIEKDTVFLKGVTIHGKYYERFGVGSDIRKTDSLTLAEFRNFNLNDLIRAEAPASFKSYGNGMLSTISFRGTGPGHTAVVWNGINVNQPTVGQTDFSIFPVFAVDEVKIHFGAASSRYGTDAIGGGILLQSRPDWNQRNSGMVGIQAGSFNELYLTGKTDIKFGDQFLSQTKVYRHTSENDFPFHNITRAGNPELRQPNASISQYGMIEDLYFRPSGSSLLTFNGWFNYMDREIQPPMTDLDNRDTQSDRNLRMILEYDLQSFLGYFEIKTGYLQDYLRYNHQSGIRSIQHLVQFSYENQKGPWEFRLGGKFNHIVADVKNYSSDVSEDRTELYGGIIFHCLDQLNLSVNIRKTFIAGYKPPVAPSLGIGYDIYNSEKIRLTLNSQASLNYRMPTLNDRYWQPGGNEDLKSEMSHNFENTLSLKIAGDIETGATLSGYQYWVKNWIMWIPGPSFWIPANVRQVHAEGMEFSGYIKSNFGKSNLQLEGNFSVTKSTITESSVESEQSIGHQLPYTPLNSGFAEVRYSYETWFLGLSTEYTGRRFVTTDNESWLPAFTLYNIRGGRTIKIKKQRIVLDFRIGNLLNKEYQTMLYRAMPGRNYRIGLNLFIN